MNKIWKAVKEETLKHEEDLYVVTILSCFAIVIRTLLRRR